MRAAGIFMLAAAAMGLPGPSASGEDLDVLEGSASELLHQYLLDRAKAQFAQRREALEDALAEPGKIEERLEELRGHYRRIIGAFPARTPLNAEVTGVLRCAGYRIEKVAFESRPDFHVTANCYVPEGGRPPFPGVLVPCGHSANGKAADAYQSVCILLAKNGFVALIVDPVCQGERYQFLDRSGRPLTRGGTTAHTLLDVGAKLTGTSVAGLEAFDNMRGIDYLASRADVDPGRIGCTGNSGGGTQTTFLIPLDERIRAAAPSCFVMTRERLFETIGPQDGCQHLALEGALGIEHADYLALFAPKPVRILAAEKDFFDIDATREAYEEVRRVYEAIGAQEAASLFSYDDEHGFSRPRREAAVQWMRRWLMNDGRAVAEPALTLQQERELWVTPAGQAGALWKNEKTVADLNMDRAVELLGQRRRFWRIHGREVCLAGVRRLIGLEGRIEKPSAEQAGTIRREGYRIEKLVLRRPREVPVPALLFLPDRASRPAPAVLHVDGRGKAADAAPGGPVERLVKEGRIVLSIDVRGFGETADDPSRNIATLWNREHRCSVLAMHIGRPLLGQRVGDVLSALEFLAASGGVDQGDISLVGVGRAGPVALHAAALDRRFARVRIEQSIRSWIDVVAAPLARDLLTHVVPFALTRYDLPDLMNVIEEEGRGEARHRAGPQVSVPRKEDPAPAPVPRGYSIPLIDLSGQRERQVIVDREAGQYLGHPTTVLLEDGRTLIAVYPKGHGRGAVVMKRSKDGGLTWSERLPVPENWSTSQEVPTIHRVIDPEGRKRLILFSGLYPVRMAVSEDDGLGWTPLEPVGDFGGIVAMASVLRLKDGRYMALFHDDGRFLHGEGKRTKFQVFKILSEDGGLTWSEPEVVAEHPAAHLCEPGAIRSPDGRRIAVLLRENSRRFNSLVIFSDDEGETWTEPREVPGALTGDRHVGRYAPDGRLFVTFRDTTHESATRGDWAGWVGTFEDIVEGREGQYRVRLMDNTRGADCAYPGLELLPDGTFVTTTYGHWIEGEQPFIVSVRFRMEEVDALAASSKE